MAGKFKSRAIPAAVRTGMALLAAGFFVYGYLSPGIASNTILEKAVKSQFSAALYGAGITGAVVVCMLLLALLTGRVFCSVLCPLGTLQELVWKTGNLIRKKTSRRADGQKSGMVRSGYTAQPRARYAVLLLTGLGLAFAFSPFMAAFDPISNFGRGMAALPAVSGGAARTFMFIIALPLVLILAAAFFRGRAFCNWCPAGLSLGLFSSFSLFGMNLAPSKCVSCGICEKKCPAGCINSKEKRIDTGRCVVCFSCAASCPGKGVRYGCRAGKIPAGKIPAGPVSGESRRRFLRRAFPFACGAVYLFGPHLRSLSGLPRRMDENLLILPPGADNANRYRTRCIGCQACAAACPERIIRAANSSRPVLDYGEAFCQYNCIECGKVCPTGAIRRLDIEEKHRTRIALSSLLFENCVVKTKGQACGACAEVCPTRAVRMTGYPESNIPYLTRPVFDEQYCIGCGACLAACPAEPKAFTISAVAVQSITPGMRPSEDEEGAPYNPADEFPF